MGDAGVHAGLRGRAKAREWLRRYGPPEIVGTITEFSAAAIAYAATGSLAVAALAGTIGAAVGYYALAYAHVFVLAHRSRLCAGATRRIVESATVAARSVVTEFGPGDILEHGNASRRSIYVNFPDGKTGLVREATHVAGAFIEQQIATALESPTPQEALAVFIAGWKKVVADSDFTAGCPIAAAGSARSLEPHTADAAGEIFARWQAAIGNSLHHHGMSESAAAALATTAVAAVEGGVLLAVAQRSLDPLDDVQGQLELLIDVHLSPTDARRTGRRR